MPHGWCQDNCWFPYITVIQIKLMHPCHLNQKRYCFQWLKNLLVYFFIKLWIKPMGWSIAYLIILIRNPMLFQNACWSVINLSLYELCTFLPTWGFAQKNQNFHMVLSFLMIWPEDSMSSKP